MRRLPSGLRLPGQSPTAPGANSHTGEPAKETERTRGRTGRQTARPNSALPARRYGALGRNVGISANGLGSEGAARSWCWAAGAPTRAARAIRAKTDHQAHRHPSRHLPARLRRHSLAGNRSGARGLYTMPVDISGTIDPVSHRAAAKADSDRTMTVY